MDILQTCGCKKHLWDDVNKKVCCPQCKAEHLVVERTRGQRITDDEAEKRMVSEVKHGEVS